MKRLTATEIWKQQQRWAVEEAARFDKLAREWDAEKIFGPAIRRLLKKFEETEL